MALMNISQYAAHRGVSRAAVHKALNKGWIRADDGKIDSDQADSAWNRAKDPSYSSRGEKKVEEKRAKPQVAEQAHPESLPDVPEGLDYVQVRTLKEFWASKREELKFKTEAKELIPTPSVAMLLSRVGVEARNKIMGIRSKVQTRNPAIEQTILDMIEFVCREVCEDISATQLDFDGQEGED